MGEVSGWWFEFGVMVLGGLVVLCETGRCTRTFRTKKASFPLDIIEKCAAAISIECGGDGYQPSFVYLSVSVAFFTDGKEIFLVALQYMSCIMICIW